MAISGSTVDARRAGTSVNNHVAVGQMGQSCAGHSATLLRDETVLVVGGIGIGWTFRSSAERNDSGRRRCVLWFQHSEQRESRRSRHCNKARTR